MAVFDSQEIGGCRQVSRAVAQAQCPVVTDAGLAPLGNPDAGVPAEVDPGGGVPYRKSRPGTTVPSEVMHM